VALRYYLMPVTETVINPIAGTIRRSPKFDFDAIGVRWQWIDYGVRPVGFLCADVSTAQHNSVISDAEIRTFPANLDNTLGGNRQTVEDALEGFNLPGAWVTTGMTYRTVLRVVVGTILIAQRFAGISRNEGQDPDITPAGVTLNTAYSDMPTGYRTRLLEAIDSLGYDYSTLGASDSLRDLMRVVGQQVTPIAFLGVTV
jgi:hypothetical protein